MNTITDTFCFTLELNQNAYIQIHKKTTNVDSFHDNDIMFTIFTENISILNYWSK